MYANNNVQVIKKKKKTKIKEIGTIRKQYRYSIRVNPGDARFSNENNKK